MTDRVRRRALAGLALGVGASVLAGAVPAPAAPPKSGFVKTVEMFEFAPGRAPMRTAVYEPAESDGTKPRALILALHYGGPLTPETGSEYAETLVLPAMKGLGAVVLAPNCPAQGWIDPVSEAAVLALVASVKKTRRIDERRVAVTGFSMGAIGAYRLAARHPDVFGAAIPVAGLPEPEDLEASRGVRLDIIHGEADQVFPIAQARRAFKALRKAGADVRVEIVPGLSHYETAAYVPALKRAAGRLAKAWKDR